MPQDNLLYSGPNHHGMETAVWLNQFWLWRSHGSPGKNPVGQWDRILCNVPESVRDGWLGQDSLGQELTFSRHSLSAQGELSQHWEMMPGQKTSEENKTVQGASM